MRRCACGCSARLQGQPTQKYASEACRKRAARDSARTTMDPDAPADSGANHKAVLAELQAAGREDTYLGATALTLAGHMDAATGVMGLAALAKELRSTMDAALKGSHVQRTSLDELRERRDAKRGA